jgi:hypothetical protein
MVEALSPHPREPGKNVDYNKLQRRGHESAYYIIIDVTSMIPFYGSIRAAIQPSCQHCLKDRSWPPSNADFSPFLRPLIDWSHIHTKT